MTSPKREKNTKAQLSADCPVTSPQDDVFGRDQYARAISRAILAFPADSSIAIAIEGEWGSGKTSVLNLIRIHLESEDQGCSVAFFNAWECSGSDSILAYLLEALARALGQTVTPEGSRKAALALSAISKFVRPLKSVPVAGGVFETLADATSAGSEHLQERDRRARVDVSEYREIVEGELLANGRRLILILDDVDRLEGREIRELMQAIKAVAPIKGITYVLSYDRRQVARVLATGADAEEGERFLEKVVQLSCPLPPITHPKMKLAAATQIESVVSSIFLDSVRTKSALAGVPFGLIAHAARYPRDLIRLSNRLLLSARALHEECHLGDVAVLEMLSIRFPVLYEAIRTDPYRFSGGRVFHPEPLGENVVEDRRQESSSGKRQDPEWLSQILDTISLSDRPIARSLIDEVFPHLREGSIQRHVRSRKSSPVDLRLDRAPALIRYLSLGPIGEVLSARAARGLVDGSLDRQQVLLELSDSEELSKFLAFAASFLDQSSVGDELALASAVVQAATESRDRSADPGTGSEEAASAFLLELLEVLPGDRRVAVFQWLANDCPSLSIAERFIVVAAQEHDLLPSKRQSPTEKLVPSLSVAQGGIASWLERVRSFAATGTLFGETNLLRILYRWGQLQDENYSEPRDFVSRTIADGKFHQILNGVGQPYNLRGIEVLLSDTRRALDAARGHALSKDLAEYIEALDSGGDSQKKQSG